MSQLVELSKAQDIEAGDGTTSVVVIAGALLDACYKLLLKGKSEEPALFLQKTIDSRFLKGSCRMYWHTLASNCTLCDSTTRIRLKTLNNV